MNVLSAMSDILPPPEAPEAAQVEEMLSDSGFLGSSFLESKRDIPPLLFSSTPFWL